MANTRPCPSCATPLDVNASFCGNCGAKLTPAAQTPQAKHTMLGVAPEMIAAFKRAQAQAEQAPPAEFDPTSDPGRTTAAGVSEPPVGQMGRTFVAAGGVPLRAEPPAPQVAAPTASAASRASADKLGKTMFGVGMSVPQPAPPAAAPAAPDPKAMGKTMFGIGMGPPPAQPSPAQPGAPRPAAAQTAYGADFSSAAATLKSSGPLQDDTDHGSADSYEQDPAPPTLRGSGPSQTLLGLEDDAPAVSSGYGRSSLLDSPVESTLPPRARSGLSLGRVLLVSVLLLAAAGLGVLATWKREPDARVRVVSDAGHDVLQFDVPGSAPGTKLRFGGQERALEAGRAQFTLAADAIRVGDNVVQFDLVSPEGDVEAGSITLSVDYRVTLDTAPLRAGKASVDVVVAARPGSQVFLDGQALPLDAQGRAVRSDPLQLGDGQPELEHVVRYRVQPQAGEATVGELRTTLRVTKLTIDRPGPSLVTDREVVEIAGEVEPNSTVRIDEQPVEVRDGRFLHQLALPKPGSYKPSIVAMAEGRAPRAIAIELTRVEDLAEAAKGFAPDPKLSYAKLVQNPEIYRGQRVELEGRVYNVAVESGTSALQVLVRDCPSGQRCPLWVSYPAATDFTVDSWVRVLGSVEGEQAFVSETGEQKRVPKIQAAFLLPSKP